MAAVQLRGGPPQLKLALAKHSCSTPVTLPTSGGGPEAGREMVVDGASLHAHLSVVAGAAAAGGGAAAALYPLALAYCGRLAATGLKVTVVLPAAAAAPGGGEWAVARGAHEAGCALLLSASAPTLLLAYARRAGPALFALLTDDTDFFVLGVRFPARPAAALTLPRRTRSPSSQTWWWSAAPSPATCGAATQPGWPGGAASRRAAVPRVCCSAARWRCCWPAARPPRCPRPCWRRPWR